MRKEKHQVGDTVKFVGKATEVREDGGRYFLSTPHPYLNQKCVVVETYQQLPFNKAIGHYVSWGEPGYKVIFEDGHTLLEKEDYLHKVRKKK
jgi:hypothetical protein